jgi:hypothetical protein
MRVGRRYKRIIFIHCQKRNNIYGVGANVIRLSSKLTCHCNSKHNLHNIAS